MSGAAGPGAGRDAAAELARGVFVAVAALTGANALFNSLATALGSSFPYTTFLFGRHDLFADYFKFVFSYPGGAAVAVGDAGGLRELLAGFQVNNPYGGIDELRNVGGITHLHVTPLTTLFSLANLRAMAFVDPVLLFAGLNAAILGWLALVVRSASGSRAEALLWFGTALLCYPTLFMLTRGNVFAGFAAVAVVSSLTRAVRGRPDGLAALLLALAINIRPNAAVFALPLLLFATGPGRARALLVLAAATPAIFVASFAAAHALYPDYTPATFGAGLALYHALNVSGYLGLFYGSSLFGGLSVLFVKPPGAETAAATVGLGIAAGAAALFLAGRISRATVVFLATAAYCLGSTVFADYHLMAFLAPLLCLGIEMREGAAAGRAGGPERIPALIASCLLLAPKNYIFVASISYQVVLNPLLLLSAAGAILYGASRAGARRPVPAAAPVLASP